jgi:hypothetical protein
MTDMPGLADRADVSVERVRIEPAFSQLSGSQGQHGSLGLLLVMKPQFAAHGAYGFRFKLCVAMVRVSSSLGPSPSVCCSPSPLLRWRS